MTDTNKKVEEALDSKQVTENKPKKEETPLEVFKVGDLNFKCHSCGHSYVIEEGVQGGIRFDLYTTSKHKLALACPQCKAVLEMYFTKGDESGVLDIDGNPVKKSSKTAEKVSEETGEDTGEDTYAVLEEETLPLEDDSVTELEIEEDELPEDLKEEIINENKEKEDEVSIQEEDKQEASV